MWAPIWGLGRLGCGLTLQVTADLGIYLEMYDRRPAMAEVSKPAFYMPMKPGEQ